MSFSKKTLKRIQKTTGKSLVTLSRPSAYIIAEEPGVDLVDTILDESFLKFENFAATRPDSISEESEEPEKVEESPEDIGDLILIRKKFVYPHILGARDPERGPEAKELKNILDYIQNKAKYINV